MYKFFVKEEQIIDNQVNIIGEDVNHIKNVLRIEKNENISICSKETSRNFKCKILDISNNEIKCEIIEKILDTTESNTYIHIFQGLPKADKMELIIEKSTEIGVKEITPVIMKRTIVKLEEKDKIKKVDRWQKIAEVASKQSKRDSILVINNILNFQNIFEKVLDYDILIIAYENEKQNTLRNVLRNLEQKENIKIAVIIGPEGGIDDKEIEMCIDKKFIPITLGKRILRTETAPIVVASNIIYELED